MDAFTDLIGIVVAVVAGLFGLIGALIAYIALTHHRDRDRRDHLADRYVDRRFRREERWDDRQEYVLDRVHSARVDLVGLERDVRLLMSERGRCDALALDVAKLEGDIGRDIATIKSEVRTLFRIMEETPDRVAALLITRSAAAHT